MLKNLHHLKNRIKIIQEIRTFFFEAGFLEVDTPALQISPGLEIHQCAFETTLSTPFQQKSQTLYLHTSPEFAMKKLLVEGLSKIYQITHAFRNEEEGRFHNPEFSMLEFYITQEDYFYLMDFTESLIKHCAKAINIQSIKFDHTFCNLSTPWERITVQEAFQKYAHIDLMATLPSYPTQEPNPTLLRKEAEKINIRTSNHDTWEDVFFRIMLDKIEAHLGKEKPTILYDYPIVLGALARAKKTNPLIAERFEIYIAGIELGNGYSELTDPDEYIQRFQYTQKMQKKLYNRIYPIDETFISALKKGLSPCTGIAIGIDRLVMLLSQASCIQEVLWLSTE